MDVDPDLVAAAFERAPQALALVDAEDFTVVAMNAAARGLVGSGPIGRSVAEWPGPVGRQLVAQLEDVRASGGTFRAHEWRVAWPDRDGTPVEHYVDLTVTPLLDGAGRPWSLLGSVTDVTDAVASRRGNARVPSRADGAVVAELQDAVLPAGLPVPQGAQLAARYLLAQDDVGAGSDWFDAVPLPRGGVVLAVGDVVGHGIGASVLMGELKALFAEVVRSDGDLVAALAALDDRVERSPEARATTLCAARFDPSSATLEYVTAGHPPPVLVPANGEPTYLPPSGAGPLASGLPVRAARRRLELGDVVLIYSDGLVERPGRSLSQNTVDLLRLAAEACRTARDEPAVDRVCRLVPELLTRPSGYRDDIALLALQVVTEVPPLRLRLPAVPETVRSVRAELDRWVAGLGVGGLDRTALQHAAGELVTNAVEHAYRAPSAEDDVTVDVRLTPDGVVEVEVRDAGSWREPRAGERGRGLSMARGFLDDLVIEHDESGTRARGRYRVTRPVPLLRGASTTAAPGHRPRGRVTVEEDVLHLTGPVDHESAEELRVALARASLGGVRAITVELAGAELLSSAAVQALYDARAAGPVGLVAPLGSPAQHVLDQVGLPYEQP